MIERGTLLNDYVYVLKRTGVAAIIAAALAVYVSAPTAAARPSAGQPSADHPTAVQYPERKLNCPARFITCMAWDKYRHAAWIGTEGHGIYEYRPWAGAGNHWVHYSTSNGLADNSCYDIAVDSRARVWAGTDRHGVDVFVSRQKGWQRYDVLPLAHPGKFGPLGSHPFAIAMDPYKPEVWLGTEAGISIYNIRRHTWNYLTVSNGLPSNQVNAINFLPGGKVIVGTQCRGLAIGTPRRSGNYAKDFLSHLPEFRDSYRWRTLIGPFHTPESAMGSGLPSSLINAVFTPVLRRPKRFSNRKWARLSRRRKVYVATDSGLAFSTNSGRSWRFEQGRDYAARVLGLFHPPAGFQVPAKTELKNLLPGEHITCIARDAVGNLWLGFWRDGYMVISPHGKHSYRTQGDPRFKKIVKAQGGGGDFVQAILPLPNGKMLIGRYGGGVSMIDSAKLAKWLKPGKKVQFYKISRPSRELMPLMVKFPKPAAVPTVRQIRALRDALMKINADHATSPLIIPLNDDWRNRGNWIDRYGRMYAYLFAQNGNSSQFGGYLSAFFQANRTIWINDHWRPGDFGRHWLVGGQRNTTDPRALQDLLDGGRTDASADDHGETYNTTIDGPNIYWTCMVPAGQYLLSIYLYNDDGHSGSNRQRDYVAEVINTPMPLGKFSKIGTTFEPAAYVDRCRPAAISRVEYFCGGVYKRFFVRVPDSLGAIQGTPRGVITVCVRRNYSFNTKWAGVFVDPVGRYPWYLAAANGVRMHWWKPIPPFKKGEPYIPSCFGWPKKQPYAPLPTYPRPSEPAYAAGSLMQQLLHLRRANEPWFAVNCAPAVAALSRYLAGDTYRGHPVAFYLHHRDWAQILSRRFFGSLVADIPLKPTARRIYYRPLQYMSMDWHIRNKHPRDPAPQTGNYSKRLFAVWKERQTTELNWSKTP